MHIYVLQPYQWFIVYMLFKVPCLSFLQPLLVQAVFYGDKEEVKLLIDRNEDINCTVSCQL